MAGGADRLDAGHAEVELDVRSAEGGEEGAAGSIHMDVDIPAVLLLQVIQRAGQGLDQLIGAGEGEAEGGHHGDGVLIHPLQHLRRIDAVAAWIHRHLTQFHVPVTAELVPADLHRTGDQVGPVRGLVLRSAARAPAMQGRHAPEHAGLAGADGGGADRILMRLGVPEIGEHPHTAAFDLGSLRIFVLVDHVLADRQIHQLVQLLALPCLAEGGEVLPGIAIEEELIVHQLIHDIMTRFLLGEFIGGCNGGCLVGAEDRIKLERDQLIMVKGLRNNFSVTIRPTPPHVNQESLECNTSM